MAGSFRDSAAEWQAAWPVVLAGAMGMALSTTHVYSTGVFIAPLEQEFHWSRAQISFGLTLVSAVGIFSGPLVGLAIDRLGPRRIALIGSTLFCVVVASFSTATASIWSWWGLWGLMAFGAAGIKPTVWTAAVSSLFVRGRGLAISLMLCGTGIGSSLTPILCNYMIERWGWRMAYVGLAAIWAVLVLPVLFLFFSSASDRRRVGKTANPGTAAVMTGLTVREGLRSVAFIKLAAAAFLVSFVVVSFVVNFVPILTSTGVTKDQAAGIAAIVGVSSVIGRVLAGMMLDRWNGNVVAGVSVAMPILFSALLLAMPGNIAVSAVVAVIAGLCLGAELDAVAYLATRHLGLRSFGVLFGTIAGLLSLSVGLGPLFVSAVYDATHAYTLVLWVDMPLSAIASALFLTLGPYPDHDERQA